MKLSAPVHRLKRKAKLIAREDKVPLHAALDRVAASEGFKSWSLLVSRMPSPAAELHARLRPGDLVLVGARPGHGKTLMGLRLAVEAMKSGRRSVFFTLEYTASEVADRFCALGVDPATFGDLFAFDASDDICAGHIVAALASAPPGTLAVIDYLQLLDQRHDKPGLMEQVRALKAFAGERGLILVFISQIDRSYDPASKPCPDLGDVRLPNPLDLTLFSKTCFLNDGEVRFRAAG